MKWLYQFLYFFDKLSWYWLKIHWKCGFSVFKMVLYILVALLSQKLWNLLDFTEFYQIDVFSIRSLRETIAQLFTFFLLLRISIEIRSAVFLLHFQGNKKCVYTNLPIALELFQFSLSIKSQETADFCESELRSKL